MNVTKNQDIVSIIMPVFNSDNYLAEAIDSALSQSYKNIELVCINDGSTDASLEIIKDYQKKNKNITLVDQRNLGVISARNNGIKIAKGKYILTLDSDDRIDRDAIKNMINIIKKGDVGIVSPIVEFFGGQNGPYSLPEPSIENMAMQNCIVSCAMFQKSSWEKYGGYDERFNDGIEDYDFWWNFLQDGKTIVVSTASKFFYRVKAEHESRNLKTMNNHAKLEKIMLNKYPKMKSLRRKGKILNKAKSTKSKVKKTIKSVLRTTNVAKWRRYKNYVLNNQLDKSGFVPIAKDSISIKKPKKLIAYYLPQFHQIKQNDEWFGKGFTEWSNVTKATPQYADHWQPHLPIDVGFYNLENTKVMHRQVELAKQYGIYGFCFYYYWFSGGSRIMEKPIESWLKDSSIDFPFMLFWANEDWTNTWGEPADIGTKTYSAKMKPSDVEKFINDIIPFISHKRYIKVNSRPHIIIYQAKKDPYLKEFISKIRQGIKERGQANPYISLVFPDDNPESFNPIDYGGDAAVEFGVHMKIRPDYEQHPVKPSPVINPSGKLSIYDMDKFINDKKFLYETEFTTHKGVMTTFDNTARKIYSGAYQFSLSPSTYRKWLSETIKHSKTESVFISAWNEWAEGMHLEPDHKYGYAYLQATRDALEENVGK